MDEEAKKEEIPDLTGGSPKGSLQMNLFNVQEEYTWAGAQRENPVLAPQPQSRQHNYNSGPVPAIKAVARNKEIAE